MSVRNWIAGCQINLWKSFRHVSCGWLVSWFGLYRKSFDAWKPKPVVLVLILKSEKRKRKQNTFLARKKGKHEHFVNVRHFRTKPKLNDRIGVAQAYIYWNWLELLNISSYSWYLYFQCVMYFVKRNPFEKKKNLNFACECFSLTLYVGWGYEQ